MIEAHKSRLTGEVIISTPLSITLCTLIIIVLFALGIFYFSQSHYSRKETVRGYTVPQKGLVKVYSNRTGIIETLFVDEGDYVIQGSPLARIRNSQSLSTGGELSVALSDELTIQIDSLKEELELVNKMHEKDMQRIKGNLHQLNIILSTIQEEKETSNIKLNLKKEKYENNKRLYVNGYISSSQLSIFHEEYLTTLSENNKLDRELASILSQIHSLKSEKMSLPEKNKIKIIEISRNISSLNVQKLKLNSQYEFIKKAPEAGTVTAIQPTPGTQLNTNTPILSIIPYNSPLEIELLLPTRAAGFVQIDDLVKVRFDAFPYQKFGLLIGKVINIDKALILPSDKAVPLNIDEPMYRVRAKLEEQSISAYGKKFPLKVGMIAEADIILEQRSLLDWILEPILAVRGKLI
ncbi:HlyD family secretion protein [Vibrio alginolyticus]|uniref:HlyD family secretion protein n=1 Tax=Vibrio alginolyticus TaxID=663 RepID=UPI00354AED3C